MDAFEDQQQQTAQTKNLLLQNEWTLWFGCSTAKQVSGADWTQSLKRLCAVRTVSEFWEVFGGTPGLSLLPNGSDLYLFKSGIAPAWEEPHNATGGKWTVMFATDVNSRFPGAGAAAEMAREAAGRSWIDTLLAAVGEQLGDHVCGCCLSVRKAHTRIAVWVSSGTSMDETKRMGRAWRRAMPSLPSEDSQLPIQFSKHADPEFKLTL